MPTQWTLDLALTTDLGEAYRYDALHAVACAFFEQSDADHDADHKPFTVRLLGPTPTTTQLIFTWLPDTTPPVASLPTTLRLGPHQVEVTGLNMTKTPLSSLGVQPNNSRVRFQATSPTQLRQHGHDYPLPDPYLTYSSLARRYHTLQPDNIDTNTARELARSIVIYHHNIHTQHFTWHGTRSAGFIGTVTFGIPNSSPAPVRDLFAKLNDLAAIAGVGHGTTHGLGAIETHIRQAVPDTPQGD